MGATVSDGGETTLKLDEIENLPLVSGLLVIPALRPRGSVWTRDRYSLPLLLVL